MCSKFLSTVTGWPIVSSTSTVCVSMCVTIPLTIRGLWDRENLLKTNLTSTRGSFSFPRQPADELVTAS